MERKILHIDVNNAFLSWTAVEMLKQGETLDIRTIPSVIGGDEEKRRGIVLAKSMPAKKVGIRTAEPIYFAKQKCPSLQIYPSDFNIYKRYSNQLYNLFLDYTDIIERFSIDECFLDITHFIPKGKTDLQIAHEINKRVKAELGFTVNVGVAPNKVLAKMASDFEKPDKVHTLYLEEISTKMWPLPVSELFMVGKQSVPKLNRLGIKTIGDLAKTKKEILINSFGKFGKMIWEYANGIDESLVEEKIEAPKGIGNSITLPKDLNDLEKLEEILLALIEQVTYRLRMQELLASTINVQIKTKDFKTYSHQATIKNPTSSTKIIFNEGKKLLQELYKGDFIRLIGIRVDNLTNEDRRQISLFETNNNEKQERLDKTIDSLKNKYGYNAVTRAGKMQIKDLINLEK